jgi:large subunit ribosomal protein L23
MKQIIQKPILSEKAMKFTAEGKYVFQCYPSSNKLEIKKAVEDLFEVKVKQVRTLLVKPRAVRRVGSKMRPGKTALRKKAYVSLMPGFSIELAGLDTSANE